MDLLLPLIEIIVSIGLVYSIFNIRKNVEDIKNEILKQNIEKDNDSK